LAYYSKTPIPHVRAHLRRKKTADLPKDPLFPQESSTLRRTFVRIIRIIRIARSARIRGEVV